MSAEAVPQSASAKDFRSDGFAVLEGFLEPGELPALRSAVDAALALPLPSGCERPHNTLAPLRWNDAVVRQVLASARRREGLTEAIGADDLRWISAYVSVKNPRSEALWWLRTGGAGTARSRSGAPRDRWRSSATSPSRPR